MKLRSSTPTSVILIEIDGGGLFSGTNLSPDTADFSGVGVNNATFDGFAAPRCFESRDFPVNDRIVVIVDQYATSGTRVVTFNLSLNRNKIREKQ